MHSILAQLALPFRKAILAAFGFEADPQIALSANDKFGDYQSNAAMGLAKVLAGRGEKISPRAVAERITRELDLGSIADEVSIAGPGFINVRLSAHWLAQRLAEAAGDPRLGVERSEGGQTVVVDYSSPNVAKEMHVGHLRSTIIGDAFCRILDFLGARVIPQNHVGDWGTQFGMLIALLKQSDPAAEHGLADLEQFYKRARSKFDQDREFQEEARRTVVRLQRGEPEEMAVWRRIVDDSRKHYQAIYDRLDVRLGPADERGESFYNPMLPELVRELKEKGVARESEGATVVFVEGYETPLIIEKSGGGYLYGTTDLAAIRYRTEQLSANRIIYVVGAPQAQHFAQVFAAARMAGLAQNVRLEYAPFGSVLGEDGKILRTRAGETVKLKDLLEEAEERAFALVTKLMTEKGTLLPDDQRREIAHAVGIGAVKYADLSKDRIGDYVFSFDNMLAMDGNTAPYLQYVYARVRSIFRKAGESDAAARTGALKLDSPFELALAKHTLRLPEVIELVARELKPHHLCNFLYELATKFSAFYENCPVITSEQPVRSNRLALCDLTGRTMALGLDLLGIRHPQQM